jgi:6,7-dimethyl-8-ribityllumazine synthase
MADPRRAPLKDQTDISGSHALIVEARFYDDIQDALLEAAIAELKEAGVTHEVITVPGALEIPAATAIAIEAAEKANRPYDAVVALGCVIRGETSHYDLITNEVARALMELSISGIPLGFGVLTVENEGQARIRADRKQKNKGAEVVAAVLRMVGLSYRFNKMDEFGE